MARVLEVDERSGHVELTLKQSEVRDQTGLTLSSLKLKKCYAGVVRAIKDFGMFVELNGSRLSGLCHKSMVLLLFCCGRTLPLSKSALLLMRMFCFVPLACTGGG